MNTFVHTYGFPSPQRALRWLRRATTRALATAAMLMAFASLFAGIVLLRLCALVSSQEDVVQAFRRIAEAFSAPL